MKTHANRLRLLAMGVLDEWSGSEVEMVSVRVMPRPTVEALKKGADALEKHGCSGLVGWLFGHNFEARFSEKMPEGTRFKNMWPDDVRAFKNRTYVCDICTRCGLQRWEGEDDG